MMRHRERQAPGICTDPERAVRGAKGLLPENQTIRRGQMPDPITALHYAANGNFASGSYDPGAVGFNLADVASASLLSYLPSGVEGLAYLGMTGGLTASFEAAVDSYIGAA